MLLGVPGVLGTNDKMGDGNPPLAAAVVAVGLWCPCDLCGVRGRVHGEPPVGREAGGGVAGGGTGGGLTVPCRSGAALPDPPRSDLDLNESGVTNSMRQRRNDIVQPGSMCGVVEGVGILGLGMSIRFGIGWVGKGNGGPIRCHC